MIQPTEGLTESDEPIDGPKGAIWRNGCDDRNAPVRSARTLEATHVPSRWRCDTTLAEAVRRRRVPDQILTDNGLVFIGRFGPGPGVVLFDRSLWLYLAGLEVRKSQIQR